jgi:hypothetical protein
MTHAVYQTNRDVDPGSDRVVYTVVRIKGKITLKYALHTLSHSVSNDELLLDRYCGCMTHEGAAVNNRFILCQDGIGIRSSSQS